jgi:lipid-A-disaccharide synthase-like uncharacterized protein
MTIVGMPTLFFDATASEVPMKRRYLIALEVVVVAVIGVIAVRFIQEQHPEIPGTVAVKLQMADNLDRVYVRQEDPQKYSFLVLHSDGHQEPLSLNEFAGRLYTDGKSTVRGWLAETSAMERLWLLVGFAGQVLFTGRMVVQWIASEKKKRSTIPPLFWWMSLLGSTMLAAYFLWRRDPVGLLGQAFGWFIYLRNISMIYGRPQPPQPVSAAAL